MKDRRDRYEKVFPTSIFDIRYPLFGLLFALCLVCLDFLSSSSAAAAEVEILTPLPSSTVAARNPETHLVLRRPVSPGVDQLRVEAGNEKLEPLGIRQHQGYDYLHFLLPLKPGVNLFTIPPTGRSLELRFQPLRSNVTASNLGKDVYLFHRNDELPPSCAACHDLRKSSPIGRTGLESQESCASCHRNILDKAARKHSATANKLCLTCHQQFVKPWKIGFPSNDIEESCLACHTGKKVWRKSKYVHGPLNVGGCTLCHNPHGDEHRYQLWADGAVDLCLTCHSDQAILMDKKNPLPYVHGIIHGPGCVACHDPHATNHQFMLYKPINELCIGCHQGLAGVTRGHPVSGHPVEGPTERRRPKRELSCTSCHHPHGSHYRDMLIGSNLGGQFCRECHK